MAQNPLLDLAVLLEEVPSLAAHPHSLPRSCRPPSVLVEPWREASPTLLSAELAGAAGAREEGSERARLTLPAASWGAQAQTNPAAGLEAATSTGRELQSRSAAGA